jgi:hypothetical protein
MALKRLSHIAIIENNMDLLSEYVLCLGYLNSFDDDLTDFSTVLKAQQQPEGHWLGPVDMKEALKGLKVPPALHSFYRHYHTTLLAWQAVKVQRTVRRMEERRASINWGTVNGRRLQYEADVLSEVSAGIETNRESTDFCFVIWIANKLKFGFDEIISDMAKELSTLPVRDDISSIENLRMVAGLEVSSVGKNNNWELKTVNEFWDFARWLTNESCASRTRSIRNRLFIEYERNRSMYIRMLALAVSFDVFSIPELRKEMAYLDTLYCPEGKFLWRENVIATPESDNTALVGKLLLSLAINGSERNTSGDNRS